ncbi:MAG: hypothetical protein RIC55_10340 [Pirellulaceae bacterium]
MRSRDNADMNDPPPSTAANPYAPPDVEQLLLAPAEDAAGFVTPRMILLTRRTARWVFLLSIVAFLGTSLIGLSILVNLIARGLLLSPGMMFGELVILLLMAIVGGLASILLFRFGLGLRRFTRRATGPELGAALKRQHTFWRGTAVGVLSVLGLFVLLIVWMIATLPFAADEF